ncbi:MAG: ABC transporter ATP-binding protein [Kiritimatiellia bacterium]
MQAQRTATLLRFIRPFRRHLAGLLLLTGVLSMLGMLPPLITRRIIDQVLTRGAVHLFFPLSLGLLAIPAMSAGASFFQHIWISYVGQKFVLRIRAAVYDHFMRLSLGFFHGNSSGKLVGRLMEDSAAVQNMVTAASVQILSDLITALVSVGITFAINWRLALLLLAVVGVFALNYRLNVVRIRRTQRQFRQSQDRLAGGVSNRLGGALTVKSYGAEAREQEVFARQSDEAAVLFEKAIVATSDFNLNTRLLQGLSHALIFFAGCGLVLRGVATYGDVVAFTAYAMQLLWPAVRFSMIAQQFQNVTVSTDRLFEILETPPEIFSAPGAVRVQRVRGKVDFTHVSFGYAADKPVLRDFDLHVEPGSMVALVGPTGCGKTTVLSLLLRFYDVQSGSICMDGRDVRSYDVVSLRRQFGIVLQESLLFNISVADNIRYARPGATRVEIEDAARMAEIHDEIVTMPSGYDTLLGARGVELSTGQKQRLSIARAILADPPMLIMDEATSALDSDSEHKIQIALGRFLAGRTAFVVAHRLSTIRDADVIMLLDGGRVVEAGSHAVLMQRVGGRYRRLYERHAGQGVLHEEDL